MISQIRRAGRALVLAGFCAAWAGCSVQRVPLRDPAAKGTAASDAPYDFQKERPSPPPPAAGGSAAAQPTLETPAATDLGAPGVAVQDLPAPAPAPSGDGATAPAAGAPGGGSGFRVQVLASTDAAAAEQARADVESRLGYRAYVRFESPYYKVRVGNCATNEDCQRLQDQLRAAGFMTVWVVPETIER